MSSANSHVDSTVTLSHSFNIENKTSENIDSTLLSGQFFNTENHKFFHMIVRTWFMIGWFQVASIQNMVEQDDIGRHRVAYK